MLTASSESDRLSNKLSSDEEEGEADRVCQAASCLPVDWLSSIVFLWAEYVQTGPYNKTYTESQLQVGGGFILPDFNEEQVGTLKTIE